MPDFGVVGAAYTAQSRTQDDQELINWYAEADPTKSPGSKENGVPGDRGVMALYPTPGLVLVGTPEEAEVRAMRTVNDTLYLVVGSTLYSYDGMTFTSQGTLNTSAGPVDMTDNGVSLYITDGSATRYYYTWGTDTFGTKVDGPFTGGAVCDCVDNFIVYNRPGTNQWACTDALSVDTNALNLGSKVASPDPIVSLIVDKSEVWLIGSLTSEVQTNTGASPFPFQALPGAVIQHGTCAAFSVARLGEGMCWLSKDTRGQGVVILVTGYQPVRISTHAVEYDISQGEMSDAIAYTYQQGGHEFYMLTFPEQNKTWCYDLATGFWHKRAWRTPGTGELNRHRSNCATPFGDAVLVGDFENGNIYELDRDTYTDNGNIILRRRRTPHVTSDLARIFHHSLQIQFQPGVGNSAVENPLAVFRWSDDGGFTWSNDHFVPVGKVGQYKNRAIKRNLGAARDRVYEIDVTDAFNAVIVSGNLHSSGGGA